MDAVDWSHDVYRRIRDQFLALTSASGLPTFTPFPVSALEGDNVVESSPRAPYYDGPPLLRYLEEIVVERPSDPDRSRLPVQLVLRPSDPALQDYRAMQAR